MESPETQLAGFLARFTPEIAARARSALRRMRKLLPPAIELVYDNYNFLVIGFSPTERPSDAVFSIALFARGVGLCFLYGAGLPDPHRLLAGGGKRVRHIRLRTADLLDDPRVRQLIVAALAAAPTRFDGTIRRRRMVIRSVSAKQRPRRPAAPGKTPAASGGRTRTTAKGKARPIASGRRPR